MYCLKPELATLMNELTPIPLWVEQFRVRRRSLVSDLETAESTNLRKTLERK